MLLFTDRHEPDFGYAYGVARTIQFVPRKGVHARPRPRHGQDRERCVLRVYPVYRRKRARN